MSCWLLAVDFKLLFGDGSQIGCKIEYAVQEIPNGLAQAFVIGEKFIGDDDVSLVLGDNIFYGTGLHDLLSSCNNPDGGIVFAYHINTNEGKGEVYTMCNERDYFYGMYADKWDFNATLDCSKY